MNTSEMTKEEITALRRRERMKGLSDSEVVYLWYRAEDADEWELTPRQQHIRERWDFAKAQFLARLTYSQVAEAMALSFDISPATARRDIAAAMRNFGDIDKVPKEMHRQRAIEMAMNAYKVAEQAGDALAMTKATNTYMIAVGLDKDDPEALDIERAMKDRLYVEVLDERIRELLLNVMNQAGGSIDTSKIFEQLYAAKGANYIEYEKLSDDTRTDQGGD